MKQNSDIDEILSRCACDLGRIRIAYSDSLHAQQIAPALRIDIKHYCEDLRSVLEYLSCDICDACCTGAIPRKRVYFPIFEDLKDFEQKTGVWYPDLRTTSPELWTYLESVQPYHDDYQWLGQFNRINNTNKHRNLMPQTRTETKRVIATNAEVQVEWDPTSVRFGAGVYIGGVRVNPRTQLPIPDPSLNVKRIIWVDFKFEEEDVSALGLLEQADAGVRRIVADVRELLPD